MTHANLVLAIVDLVERGSLPRTFALLRDERPDLADAVRAYADRNVRRPGDALGILADTARRHLASRRRVTSSAVAA